MNIMEFNSQISTTIDQSKKLIELGLKIETADMFHIYDYTINDINGITPIEYLEMEINDIPSWSFHRLYTLIPTHIKHIDDKFNLICLWKMIGGTTSVLYEPNDFNDEFEIQFSESDNLYDNIISCIEWLIKNNYFNKEFLN